MSDAEVIRSTRREYGLTQKRLAELPNVSVVAIKSGEGAAWHPSGSAIRLLQLMRSEPATIGMFREQSSSTLSAGLIAKNVDEEKPSIEYISKMYALNIADPDGTAAGDWHWGALDWNHIPLKKSSDSVLGNYGIRNNVVVPHAPGRPHDNFGILEYSKKYSGWFLY
jgi:transcriptional regulator with XRE-family HTH domain